MDYSRFEIGISERRTAWLVNFIDKLEASGWLVMVRRFHEFHGRLGFSAQVLPWIRPLLAPGYAWLAAVSKNSTMRVPELVATVCIFIRKKFTDGLRKIPCVRAETDLGEIFRTDAKCEAGKVVLGGWVTYNNTKPKDAAWFSLEVLPGQAPWLFRGEQHEAAWASTSAELLASLVALKVFRVDSFAGPGQRSHVLRCGGGTDNKATGMLVQRRLSTKLPLMIILMDYLAFSEEVGIRCDLDWRPRDVNVEADDLTNQIFNKFEMNKRIQVSWEDLRFPMIDLLMAFTESFSKRKFEAATAKDTGENAKFQKSEWG